MAGPNKTTSQEASIIVALMDQVQGLRGDIAKQTDTISKKLDEQTRETRDEFKDIREDLTEIKTRLASGSEQIRTLRRDVDAQGRKCDIHGTASALERKAAEAETAVESPPKKMAWWLPLLIGGALAWVGERGVKFLINGIADPPAAVSPSKS